MELRTKGIRCNIVRNWDYAKICEYIFTFSEQNVTNDGGLYIRTIYLALNKVTLYSE